MAETNQKPLGKQGWKMPFPQGPVIYNRAGEEGGWALGQTRRKHPVKMHMLRGGSLAKIWRKRIPAKGRAGCPGLVTDTGHLVDLPHDSLLPGSPFPLKLACLVPSNSEVLPFSQLREHDRGCWASRLHSYVWASSMTHNCTSVHVLTVHPVPGTASELQVHYIIYFLQQPCEGHLIILI